MTVFDFVFLGILAASVLLGAWRGLVSELFALAGLLIAVVLAWQGADWLAPYLSRIVTSAWLQWLLAFATIVVVVLLVMALLRFLIRELLKVAGLNLTDRLAGAVFGVLRALLVSLGLVAAGGLTDLPRETWWQTARFAPPLETMVIALKPRLPKALAARIRYR